MAPASRSLATVSRAGAWVALLLVMVTDPRTIVENLLARMQSAQVQCAVGSCRQPINGRYLGQIRVGLGAKTQVSG